jgi:hypothetical protein
VAHCANVKATTRKITSELAWARRNSDARFDKIFITRTSTVGAIFMSELVSIERTEAMLWESVRKLYGPASENRVQAAATVVEWLAAYRAAGRGGNAPQAALLLRINRSNGDGVVAESSQAQRAR